MSNDDATRPFLDDDAPGAPAGVDVPGFRILRKLGEGGMGVVFEAEQQTPRRRVALKLVRGGGIADDLRVRLFKREADMLARLEHPNIAAIYATGRTPSGHDWFAMELVEGETLGEWMARTGSRPRDMDALRDRLELFRAICDAVSYAHQRGVIHRDLKPSNLVVTPAPAGSTASDTARPRVKVLDFGLARLTETDAEGETAASHTGAVRGTLPYMSPEQARGDVAAIDVRTDVYALGVILYELLAGRRPYDVPSGLLEAVRAISEAPPRPMAETWPGPGRPDPDLETITRKALAKDAVDRYASADALNEDVRRWLASEPILARPPSTIYQIRKLVARHRAPFLAAAAMLALIVVAAVTTSVLYVRSERNLERALAAEAQAVTEAKTTQETYDFLVSVFDVARPDRARSEQLTAREILENAAARVRGESTSDPVVRARLMATIGDVFYRLGLNAQARSLLEESLQLREANLAPDAPEVATGRNLLGIALVQDGEYAAALAQYEQAVQAWTARGDTVRPEMTSVLGNQGWLLGEMNRFDEGMAVLQRAESLMERIPDADGTTRADLLLNLASVRTELGDPAGAVADLERAAGLLEAAGRTESLHYAALLTNLGAALNTQGRPADALARFEKALALRRKFLDPDAPIVAEALGNMGVTHAMLGEFDKGIPYLQEQVAITEAQFGAEHPQVQRGLYNLGLLRVESGDLAGARAPLERALALAEKNYGPESMNVSAVLFHLAEVNRAEGKREVAKRQLERVVAIDDRPESGAAEDLPGDLEALARVLRELGDTAGADAAEARARALSPSSPSP